MKIWGIVTSVFLIASLIYNCVLYGSLSQAKADYASIEEKHEQLENSVIGIGYRLNSALAGIGYRPENDFDTVDKALDGIDTSLSFIGELVDEMQEFTTACNELKTENEMLKETLAQIQLEAEQAQQSGFWDDLLQFIFSIIS